MNLKVNNFKYKQTFINPMFPNIWQELDISGGIYDSYGKRRIIDFLIGVEPDGEIDGSLYTRKCSYSLFGKAIKEGSGVGIKLYASDLKQDTHRVLLNFDCSKANDGTIDALISDSESNEILRIHGRIVGNPYSFSGMIRMPPDEQMYTISIPINNGLGGEVSIDTEVINKLFENAFYQSKQGNGLSAFLLVIKNYIIKKKMEKRKQSFPYLYGSWGESDLGL